MTSNNNSGRLQLAVTSWSKPNRIGPVAASEYPMDCDMPDNEAASWAFFVRKLKKIIARLNADPPPIPSKMVHNGRSAFPLQYRPAIAAINKLAVMITSKRWFFMRPATIGMMNETGSAAI
ncbi:hypothetical protein J40TS1_21040 [Paenibacillus montaniterrae]|uniref:Uncharacterized protein n=1 Tax=Paenibacillus montaniterrae TaxID=429341 RepID=A0A920CTZ5_9BACL|nr:hypothetical protein J40TS1_21040 [Paenibacillus montaniterrae]